MSKIIKQIKPGEEHKQERTEAPADNINTATINNHIERVAQIITSAPLPEPKREEQKDKVEYFNITLEPRSSAVFKFKTRKYSFIVVEQSQHPPLKYRVVFRDADSCDIEFINIHTEPIKTIVYFN